MKEEVRQYNNRQINLIKAKIKFLRNNEISIGRFIDEFDSLIACIQNPPLEWKIKLKHLICEIEIIYAWALAKEKNLSNEELDDIFKFINEIEKLITWYKEEFLSEVEVD